MMGKTRRIAAIARGGPTVLLLTIGAALAQAQGLDDVHEFHIEAQPLDAALIEFSEQADLQLMVQTELVTGRQSAGVTGALTASDALLSLLNETDLAFEAVGEDTVAVSQADAGGDSDSGNRAAAGATPIVMAQSQTVAQRRQAGQADERESEREKRPTEEIVVTGTRLRRGQAEIATSVTIFAEHDIERLGAVTVADVLDYLPQRSFSLSEDLTFGGSQSVQLRGLGLGTTLVLINGRRTVTSALQGARSFFDVNTIPLPAVERIEVLSNSASAVYGADAVAGVVNIILKDDIEHPVVDLYYGFTPNGASDEKRASLSFGLSSDRFRSAFTFDYFERTPLFGYERKVTASQDLRRLGGIDARSATANPGNVFSIDGGPLPGLDASFAGVPPGSTGVGLTSEDFEATDGVLNLVSLNRFRMLIPKSKRASAVALADLDVTDTATIFGEFMYVDREDVGQRSPAALSRSLVPAANPFNPFGVPVRVSYLLTGIGPRRDITESRSYRAVAGAKGNGTYLS